MLLKAPAPAPALGGEESSYQVQFRMDLLQVNGEPAGLQLIYSFFTFYF